MPTEIQQAQRQNEPVGFLLLSADNLGTVNERHGRNAGDQMLGDLAELLQSITRGEELLGHLDGTNFALMFYPATEPRVRERAESLRTQVVEHTFAYDGAEVALTISTGAISLDSSSVTDPRSEAADIFARLNEALYRAKQAGGNCVEIARNP